jgi:hypothetical protein
MAVRPLSAGFFPTRVTVPVAANTLIERGMIVQFDAANRGIPGAHSNGFKTAGIATSTVDNRTGGPYGGAAGAVEVELDCGIVGVDAAAGDTDIEPGDVLYVATSYTVTNSAEDNGAAGVCHEVRNGKIWVQMSPVMSGLVNEIIAIRAEIAALS